MECFGQMIPHGFLFVNQILFFDNGLFNHDSQPVKKIQT